MSIKVSTWVWEHAPHRGTQKLLLLALADFANDSGICWPSAASLAKRIGETERHTRQLIKALVDADDLLIVAGGGRGNTTRYAIAVGLTPKQREKLNNALQNTVSQNSDQEKTVISGDLNSVLQSQETVISGDLDEGTNSATGRGETDANDGGIRHVDPSVDPKIPATRKKRVAAAPSTEHQNLMAAYADWLGYQIPNGAKEGAAAKRILAAGYTVEQVDRCYHELKRRDFYSGQHLSLSTVYEQMGALIAARKARPSYAVPQNGTNGHQPAERMPTPEETAAYAARYNPRIPGRTV